MRPIQMAIVSIEDDLHALIIQKALDKYGDLECRIIESNRICGSATLNWFHDEDHISKSSLPVRGDSEGLNVRNLDVIWWRRVGFPQVKPATITDPAQI